MRTTLTAAAAACLLGASCAHDGGAAMTASPGEGRLVEVDGRAIHVLERGEGPAVLLIHGASNNANDMMLALGDALAPYAHVVAMDRPGLGLSEAMPERGERLARHAAAALALAEELGLERPVLVGHSYGGAVALRAALDAPGEISGAVLLGAPTHGDVGPVAYYNHIAAAPILGPLFNRLLVPAIGPGRLEDGLGHTFAPQPVPEAYAERAGIELLFRPASFRSNAVDLSRVNRELLAQQDRYDELEVPVVFIAGTQDRTVSTERHSVRAAEVAPNATLDVLEGVGHMPHWADRDLVVERVRALLRAAPPS